MGDYQGDDRAASSGIYRFRAFADDTPRDDDVALDDERWDREPLDDRRWHDSRWHDDRDQAPPPPSDERLRAEGPPRRSLGVAAAALAGLAIAVGGGVYLARNDEPASARPAPPVLAAVGAPAAPAGGRMDVEVAQAAPLPAVSTRPTGERLEVLPPQSARPSLPRLAAQMLPFGQPSRAPAAQASPEAPTPTLDLAQAQPAPRVAPAPAYAAGPTGRDVAATEPPPRASYDCRDAPSAARALVCQDRRLAVLDQQMKRAYAAALAAGIPADELRADQDDWLDVREDAARVSRTAVADIYRQRIGELRRAADDGY